MGKREKQFIKLQEQRILIIKSMLIFIPSPIRFVGLFKLKA